MYVIVGIFVFLLCYVLTPVVARLAWKIGAVDVPLDGRRMHRRSIPRDGGVAMFFSFLLGLVLLNGLANGIISRILDTRVNREVKILTVLGLLNIHFFQDVT